MPFCMPYFPSRNIITHQFNDNDDKYDAVIGYYMIIVRDLMVNIGIIASFKRKVLEWDDFVVHIK